MPFDLAEFSLLDMLKCGRAIRKIGADVESMNEAAAAIVAYLYAELESEEAVSQRPALVRFYKTQTYSSLDPSLQAFARAQMKEVTLTPEMRCLTLLASAGVEPEWCDPRQSVGHRAIPLPSESIVEQAPMIAQLIRELGLEIREVIAPDPTLLQEREGRTYNVFHVAEAAGSPFIPVQAGFVERYGIRSVIGFGGLLADGELFAVVIFARGRIPAHSAARFRNIALDVKAAIYPFAKPFITHHENLSE